MLLEIFPRRLYPRDILHLKFKRNTSTGSTTSKVAKLKFQCVTRKFEIKSAANWPSSNAKNIAVNLPDFSCDIYQRNDANFSLNFPVDVITFAAPLVVNSILTGELRDGRTPSFKNNQKNLLIFVLDNTKTESFTFRTYSIH